jgi:hypothetical protein
MTKFVKWNSLNQFHEVVKSLGHNRLYQVLVANDYKITYGLKIKLHGTNAAVRIDQDGKVTAQKRSSDLIGNADNAGFRKWVESNESYFSMLAKSDAVVIVYGEWAGPGIQSGVSVSDIPTKTFFPFALDSFKDDGTYCRLYDPEHMEHVLGDMPNDMVVIPWHGTLTIDFVSKEETEKTLFGLNKLTEQVGEEDPFIKEMYGKSGCGEGFVCYPFLGERKGIAYVNAEAEHFSHFNFKAKSEHHRVNKTKAAVNFNPETFANKNRFADAFCTEARFEQGYSEFLPEQVRTMKDTPTFIKWVCSDVFKESTSEQAATSVSWSDLSKTIAARAAIWYKNKVSQTL